MTRTTPRFCYVVLCHTDAANVLRLVRRIRQLSPTASVLLRHDRGEGYLDAGPARAVGADLLRSDIPVAWGGWSLVRATVEALEHARATVGADHYVLLSGHHYPIRDLAAWEDEVTTEGVDALVDRVLPLTEETYAYRWHEPFRAPAWVPAVADRGAAHLASRVDPVVRGLLRCYRNDRDLRWVVGVRRLSLLRGGRPPVPLVKGSQWLTVSAPALDRVLRRHHGDDAVRRFFATTKSGDEMYLQSLLHADPGVRVVDRATTYARFDGVAPSPVWLDREELRAAARTPAPFARKMPPDAPDVLAVADELTRR